MTSTQNFSPADHGYLQQAIDLAVANAEGGGGPFGAVIVKGEEMISTGQNHVTRDNDPTAHAEVTAIRSACATLGTFSLAGATLYSSCEPCPMCLAACLWARLDRVIFAADRHDAAAGGFDDRAFYDQLDQSPATWTTPLVQQLQPGGETQPFQAWLRNADRTDY